MLLPRQPIHTARLTLRPFVEDDLEPLRGIYQNRDVVRYLYTDTWTPALAREQLRRRTAATRFGHVGDMLALAIEMTSPGTLVGDLLLFLRSETHRTGEMGFVLHPQAQGRGLATEATRALLDIGFGDLELHRIIGRCDARNGGSARLMARLGMRQEGHFRQDEYVKGEWCDTLVFAMLAGEWIGTRGR